MKPPTPEPSASPIPAPTPAPGASPVAKPPTAPPSAPVAQPTSPPAPVTQPTSPPSDDGTNPPHSVCNNYLWAKCDGRDWDGSPFSGEKCCPDGAYCNWQTEWYSQCIPVESCSKGPWDQCAGAGFYESNCCPAGHYCKSIFPGYSQCAPL